MEGEDPSVPKRVKLVHISADNADDIIVSSDSFNSATDCLIPSLASLPPISDAVELSVRTFPTLPPPNPPADYHVGT